MKTKLILQYIRRLTGPLPVLTQRVAGIPTDKTAFTTAISAATTTRDAATTTIDRQISEAITKLSDATNTFKAAIIK